MTARFAQLIGRGQRHGQVDPNLDPEFLATSLLAQMEGLMVIAKATNDPTAIRRLPTAARSLLIPPAPNR
jgi:hypothetical protein